MGIDSAIPPLPEDVRSRLYPSRNYDLFSGVWKQLKETEPSICCRSTKRYIGMYVSDYGKRIFAYVDAQRTRLLIGVHKDVFDKLQIRSFKPESFPDWSNRELVGISLHDGHRDIVPILRAALIAKLSGLQAIQPLPQNKNAKSNKLLAKCRSDLKILKREEERFEGTRKERWSTYCERDPKLRADAIAVHGTTCMVDACRFNFCDVYGRRGRDFIEVHHIHPLSSLKPGELQKTDPATDLVVVCSNCHRMIHRSRVRVLTLDEVSELISARRRQKTCNGIRAPLAVGAPQPRRGDGV